MAAGGSECPGASGTSTAPPRCRTPPPLLKRKPWCLMRPLLTTEVELLRSQKTDKVDVTLAPEELDEIDNVLSAKYEEAREEEKLRNQKEDFSDMVAENAKKRKRKMQEKESKSKKKDFKF